MLAPRDTLYLWLMWGVVLLVTIVSAIGCYATQEGFAARLPFVTSCSVAAVVMLTLLVEKTMNHNGGVWRDGKYRRAVPGTNDKLFCMFCTPAFWAEALATGFDSCGMDGGGLPRLAVQPLLAPPPGRDPQLLPDSAAPSAATAAGGDHSSAAAAVSAAPEAPPPPTEVRIAPPTLPPAIPVCPPSAPLPRAW